MNTEIAISPKVILDQYIKNRIVDLAIFYSVSFSRSSEDLLKSLKDEYYQRLDELFYLRDNFNK